MCDLLSVTLLQVGQRVIQKIQSIELNNFCFIFHGVPYLTLCVHHSHGVPGVSHLAGTGGMVVSVTVFPRNTVQ